MDKMIRVRLPEKVHWLLKVEVAKQSTTIQEVVSTLIKDWLKKRLKEQGIEVNID